MEESRRRPEPIKTGSTNHIYRCPMKSCPYFCWTHLLFQGHLERQHRCNDCSLYLADKYKHVCQHPGQRRAHANYALDLTNFCELSSSHGGSVSMYTYNKPVEEEDIEKTFEILNNVTIKFLNDLYDLHSSIKLEICVGVKMEKETRDEDGSVQLINNVFYFKSDHFEMHTKTQVPHILMTAASQIVEKKNNFMENSSGWYIKNIASFEVKMADLRLFRPKGGARYLPMPFEKNSLGVVNFRNKDDKCFLYCVTAAIFWDEQVQLNRVNKAKDHNLRHHKTWEVYLSRLDVTGVEGSVNVKTDIDIFEKNNNVAVTVFTHDNQNVVILRKSPMESYTVMINLFLIRENTFRGVEQHYVLIRDLSKFFCAGETNKKYYCQTCFRKFTSVKRLQKHSKVCGHADSVEETLPKEGACLEFKRHEMTLPYPFTLYYDFETFSCPLDENKGASTKLNAEYKPASYSLCVVSHDSRRGPRIYAAEYYNGEDPVEHFFERVFHYAKETITEVRMVNNHVMPTKEERERFKNATQCEFCRRHFTSNDDDDEMDEDELFDEDGNLRDFGEMNEDELLQQLIDEEMENHAKRKKVIKCYHHNHFEGRYIHALCQNCNLKVKYKNELVCICHNASGFDFHLLLQNLESRFFDARDVQVISKGGEKLVQIEITAKDMYLPELRTSHRKTSEKAYCGQRRVKARFIDSAQFLLASLDSLSQNIRKENASSMNLVKHGIRFLIPGMVDISNQDLDLLLAKLPFPYSYLSSPQVLESGHPMPDRSCYYNELKKEEINDEQWETVKRVCDTFHITDFRQFTRLYCLLDSVLLAAVWENFRKNCMDSYNLCPNYVCTASGYSWHAFLKYTGAQVDYVRDFKMLSMIKEGIRGGMSFCTQKVVTANNERSPLGYDDTKERTHIVYNDKVSLYATAMLEKLPQSDYEWVEPEELAEIDWKSYDGENNKGYILRVDLRYPEKLQDETVDLPLAPEKRRVKLIELSSMQQDNLLSHGLATTFTTAPRLLLHCDDRIGYVLHYKALKFYLGMGMELVKIHEGIRFTETAYLRPYIEYNIEQRKLAQSESQRALFKLLLNSIFGKTLQSNRGNLITRFCGSKEEAEKWIANSRCVDFMPISENISMIMLSPETIVLDKPIQCGMSILDVAKVILYDGYYNQLKNVFPGGIYNSYVDTDSSIIEIRDPTNTFLEDIVRNRSYFDFSKLPKNHEIFTKFANIPTLRTDNASVAGKWKLESIDIAQIVTITSKQYSVLYFDGAEEKKAKGLPAPSLKSFSHDDYKTVVETNKPQSVDCNYIRSIKHRLYNVTVRKVGFRSLDLYRHYPDRNNINFSLPFGHYRLKEWESDEMDVDMD